MDVEKNSREFATHQIGHQLTCLNIFNSMEMHTSWVYFYIDEYNLNAHNYFPHLV